MREFTNRLIELVEEGMLNPIDVVRMCVKYMSEDEVEEMCDMNELTDLMFEPDEEEDEDEEEFDSPQEFTHVNEIWDVLEQCETEEEIDEILEEVSNKFGTWFSDRIDVGVIEVTNQWWDDNQQDMMSESQRFEVRFMED